MSGIVSGALFAGYALAGLFFLRFWKESRDRLFAMFAVAFWLLATQRMAIAVTNSWMEDQWVFYLLRLAAFVVIIVAIVDKNRR
ncbi:MAG: DUF5985 family protein [Thermoanaerobaculia bacterium]